MATSTSEVRTRAVRVLQYDGSAAATGQLSIDLPRGERQAVVRPDRIAVSQADFAHPAGSEQAIVPGRSFVGTVQQVGASHSHELVGRRVIADAATWCGECAMCVAGLRQHCRSRAVIGIDRPGALADAIVLPIENLVVVPDGVDDDQAAFAERIASAIQILRQLTIVGKPYISVLGDSLLGFITAQIMSRLNASVRLLGSDIGRLAVCEKWQIKHRLLSDVGRRADQDIVIVCDNRHAFLQAALAMTRPRGTIVIKTSALHLQDKLNISTLMENELHVIGSSTGPVTEALGYLQRGEVDVISLISGRMKLDDGPAILRNALQPQTVSIVVDP